MVPVSNLLTEDQLVPVSNMHEEVLEVSEVQQPLAQEEVAVEVSDGVQPLITEVQSLNPLLAVFEEQVSEEQLTEEQLVEEQVSVVHEEPTNSSNILHQDNLNHETSAAYMLPEKTPVVNFLDMVLAEPCLPDEHTEDESDVSVHLEVDEDVCEQMNVDSMFNQATSGQLDDVVFELSDDDPVYEEDLLEEDYFSMVERRLNIKLKPDQVLVGNYVRIQPNAKQVHAQYSDISSCSEDVIITGEKINQEVAGASETASTEMDTAEVASEMGTGAAASEAVATNVGAVEVAVETEAAEMATGAAVETEATEMAGAETEAVEVGAVGFYDFPSTHSFYLGMPAPSFGGGADSDPPQGRASVSAAYRPGKLKIVLKKLSADDVKKN